MATRSEEHFESAFDAFWQAQDMLLRSHTLLAKCQLDIAIASMTVGVEFWGLWHDSRGRRAIQSVDQSHFGEHRVIAAKFPNYRR